MNNMMSDVNPLPELPPKLRLAVSSYSKGCTGLQPTVLGRCLGQISDSAQELFEVESGLVAIPTSLNSFRVTHAPPGVGKSSIHDRVSRSRRKALKKHRDEVKHLLDCHNRVMSIWEKRGRRLERNDALLMDKINTPEYESLVLASEAALAQHQQDKPPKPVLVTLEFNKIDASGVLCMFENGATTATLRLDEAKGLLASKNQTLLDDIRSLFNRNPSWIKVDRFGRQTELADCCLSLDLSIPTEELVNILNKKNSTLRESGLLSRMWFFGSNVTIAPDSSASEEDQDNPCDERIAYLTTKTIEHRCTPNSQRIGLKFTPNAQHSLKQRMENNSYRTLNGMDDFYSRFGEHVVKLAGLLHLIEYDTTEISLETLDYAWGIALWLAREFHRICVPVPIEAKNAATLITWLRSNWIRLEPRYSIDGFFVYIERQHIKDFAEGSLHNGTILNNTLDYAEKLGWLMRELHSRKTLIKVPITMLNSQSIGYLQPNLSYMPQMAPNQQPKAIIDYDNFCF